MSKRADIGLFFSYYYYYWYFGQVCPGLKRRMGFRNT